MVKTARVKGKASSYLSADLAHLRGLTGDTLETPGMAAFFQGLLKCPLFLTPTSHQDQDGTQRKPVSLIHLEREEPRTAGSGRRKAIACPPSSGLRTRFSGAQTQRQKRP